MSIYRFLFAGGPYHGEGRPIWRIRSEPCAERGHHSWLLWRRRRGPFWARRDEYRCGDCDELVRPAGGVTLLTPLD